MATKEESTMTIWEHLDELRRRLLVALAALALTTVVSLIFADRFVQLLTVPIGGLQNLQSIEVTENVGVFMRTALLSGLVLAMPVIVYELLSFIAPGLTPSERKWIYIGVPLATLLFLTGVLFSYFVMLPAAIPFLIDFMGVKTVPRLSNYISFVTNLLFWVGVSFETPLLVFILAKMKLVTAGALLKQWRIAVVVIAVLAAVVTPTTDPVNMSLLMIPLFVLYLLSVLLAFLAR
jgi:sec-independent protein translocase protein TatC